jgi:NADH-quinone oxidoreductase subunit J
VTPSLLAPVMVAAALGILFTRKAVHAALLLAVVMIGLAVMYALQDAPFLFAVQIIVYTGAILMLFLFVLMLVGVDASDSVVETIKGQRLMATVVGLLFGAVLVVGVAQVTVGAVTGLEEANAEGNVPRLRSALLRLRVRLRAAARCHHRRPRRDGPRAPRALAEGRPGQRPPSACATTPSGKHLSRPAPGVRPPQRRRHPGVAPDGTPSEASVSRVLAARGTVRSAPALADDISVLSRQMRDDGSSNVPGEPDATPKGPIQGDPSDQTPGREGQA